MIRCVSDSLSLARIGSAFWSRIKPLVSVAFRVWIPELSWPYVLKLRFGHVLEQEIAFGRRKQPRLESTS